jgi:hypothetical protein
VTLFFTTTVFFGESQVRLTHPGPDFTPAMGEDSDVGTRGNGL